ncbi:type 1 fimbrial protein [Enterobacter cloacae]|nr:type 1 fimbrial protein [Enterobacter cloacae]
MKNIIGMLASFVILAVSKPIMAANSTQLKVNGSIYTVPCSLVQSQLNQNIDFKTLRPTSGAKPEVLASTTIPLFYFRCPIYTQTVKLKIYGTPDLQVKDGAYANTGTAKNIAILIKSNSTVMSNGKQLTLPVTSGDNLKQFPLTASVVSRGNATSGTIRAEVTFEITFS